MFHVRRAINAQNSLSILNNKYSTLILSNNNKIKNFNLFDVKKFKSTEANTNTEPESLSSSIDTLILSESCIKRLKEVNTNQKEFLRILVDSGGCSGLEYKFSLDSNLTKEDKFIEKDGCKILVDTETLGFIKGSTVDYYEELIRSGFRITNNPNSEHGCSCGASFSIKI